MALENIGGAWLKEKNGKKFMSVSLDAEKVQSTDGKINMLMYKNDYKEKDNQPDYKLFQIQDGEKSNQNQERNQASNQGYSNNQHPMSHGNQEPEQQVEDPDSIPF